MIHDAIYGREARGICRLGMVESTVLTTSIGVPTLNFPSYTNYRISEEMVIRTNTEVHNAVVGYRWMLNVRARDNLYQLRHRSRQNLFKTMPLIYMAFDPGPL